MSDRDPYPSEKQDRFIVRLPDGMRNRIKAAAEANNRSMNAEIIAALEEKFPPLFAHSVFERGVLAMLHEAGWTVENNRNTRDFGIDMIAIKGPVTVAIECKSYLSRVSPGAVTRVAAAREHLGANAAVILGYGSAQPEALAEAEDKGLLIIDVDKEPNFLELFSTFKPFSASNPFFRSRE